MSASILRRSGCSRISIPSTISIGAALSIRHIRESDAAEFVRMRLTFWPDSAEGEAIERIRLPPGEGVTFVAERKSGGLSGFAEVGLRKWAEGCDSSPVPYLEGIWVDGDCRRMGLATLLMEEVESWCRSRGFPELGSDCEITNEPSVAFHKAAGFEEVLRNVSFRKDLE